MKRLMVMLLAAALVLAACSSNAPAAPLPGTGPDTYQSKLLTTDYEGATSVRNQFMLGTLNLAGTPQAVTAEQAAKLLPLWQALRATTKTGGASQDEINALLSQIEGSMTAEQLTAIHEMKLSFSDMQTWAQANGVTLGAGGGQPGMGMTAEQRATRQAQEGRTPGSAGGAMTALMDAVIKYLEGLGG
jgi:hypothetical protein